jgi:hypothetical protein
MKKMKQTIYIAIISIIGLFANSCSEEDSFSGLINNVIGIDCFPQGQQKEWIITNDSVYKQIFTDYSASCIPPPIDFNKYSLLGIYTTAGCKVSFKREVIKLDSELKYHYKVTVNSRGICSVENISYNWVTVPKLPTGWTVTFEVKNK